MAEGEDDSMVRWNGNKPFQMYDLTGAIRTLRIERSRILDRNLRKYF